MKFSKLVIAVASFMGIAAVSVPAQASDPCTVTGWGCNLVITFSGGSSLTPVGPTFTSNNGVFSYFPVPPATNQNGDDVLIGVINASTTETLNSFFITTTTTSSTLGGFGFDGTGICAFTNCAAPAGALSTFHTTSAGFGNGSDPTGYGGQVAFFTDIGPGALTGRVNFFGGIAPGGTAFFSLEHPLDNEHSISVAIPEPETYALMLAGLGLMGFVSRRRKQRVA